MDGELVMNIFNDNITIMLIGFEILIILGAIITALYCLVSWYINTKYYNHTINIRKPSKYEIYDRYKEQKQFKQPK